VLELPRNCFDEIVAHALDNLPNEMCGVLGGVFGAGRFDSFVPMRNAAASPIIYSFDAAEWQRVDNTLRARGLDIVGIVHSHTRTTAYPSPTDVREAADSDPFGAYWFLIVSLKHAQPSLRAFKIDDGRIREEPLRLSDANR